MSNIAKQRRVIIVSILLSAILMRLVPHIPNFAPVTAAALFSGAFLPKKYVLLVPLLIVAVSDYLLLYINPFSSQVFNFSELQPISALVHSTTPWVWASFMISGLIGLALRSKQNVMRVSSFSILASLQFFLITNFGVWAAGAYARNWSGLVESYVAGLPFLNWTLLGDLFYTGSFFALYALMLNQYEGRSSTAKITA